MPAGPGRSNFATSFRVRRFDSDGDFAVTVTLFAGNGDATANGSASVADAPLTATGVPVDVVRGTPLANQRLATFTDADPAGTPSDYTATIDWGDGTTGTPGAVAASPGGGFAVNGSHGYTYAGTYPVAITVRDAGGATATAQTTVAVSLPGGQLAFASTRSGKSEIWTMRVDGTGQTQLTSNAAGEFFSPACAPGRGWPPARPSWAAETPWRSPAWSARRARC